MRRSPEVYVRKKKSSAAKILGEMKFTLRRVTKSWESVIDAELWIERVTGQPKSLMFSVLLKEPHPMQDVQIIGFTGLNQWDKLHYVFHPNFWGSGYCTEAVKAFLNVLFERQPDRQSLKAVVLDENISSLRVLEKCNFVIDPSRKNSGYSGRRHLPKNDYDSLKSALSSMLLHANQSSSVVKQSGSARVRTNFMHFCYTPSKTSKYSSNKDHQGIYCNE
jgi:RimJ/RimL family protein N-acetyltransferase